MRIRSASASLADSEPSPLQKAGRSIADVACKEMTLDVLSPRRQSRGAPWSVAEKAQTWVGVYLRSIPVMDAASVASQALPQQPGRTVFHFHGEEAVAGRWPGWPACRACGSSLSELVSLFPTTLLPIVFAASGRLPLTHTL